MFYKFGRNVFRAETSGAAELLQPNLISRRFHRSQPDVNLWLMFRVCPDDDTGFSNWSGRLGKLNLPSLASLHRFGTAIDSVMPVVSTEMSAMASVVAAVVSTIMPTMTSVIPAVTAVVSAVAAVAAVAAVVIVPKPNTDSAAVAIRRLCIGRLI